MQVVRAGADTYLDEMWKKGGRPLRHDARERLSCTGTGTGEEDQEAEEEAGRGLLRLEVGLALL